jgi:hypothetical protein
MNLLKKTYGGRSLIILEPSNVPKQIPEVTKNEYLNNLQKLYQT